ncbi:MAG: DUF2750 domain-containing protein [Pseudomonadota bacterium]
MTRTAEERELFQSISDDDRREARRIIPPGDVEALLKASAADRVRYLVDEVLGQEEVWVAFDEDYLTGWDDSLNDVTVTPIWPHRQFVENFGMSQSNAWEPVPIPIVDWVDMVTPDLVAERRMLAVFPIDGLDFEITDPVAMVDQWEVAWKSFAKHWERFGDRI